MTIDFDKLLFGPLHNTFGVSADFVAADNSLSFTETVIDATSGVELPGRTPLELATVRPVAYIRSAALVAHGVARSELRGGTLYLNGRTYRVETTAPRPTTNGEDDGELMLVLIEVA